MPNILVDAGDCRHCGKTIVYSPADASYYHRPITWGSQDFSHPAFNNGYYCHPPTFNTKCEGRFMVHAEPKLNEECSVCNGSDGHHKTPSKHLAAEDCLRSLAKRINALEIAYAKTITS